VRNWLAATLYVALAAATGLLAYLASLYPTFPGDRELALLVQGMGGQPMHRAMSVVSAFGDWWLVGLLPLGMAVLLLSHRRFQDLPFLAAALAPQVLNRGLKLLVDRPRPGGLDEGLSSSFPSGHAVHAVVFYGFLFCLVTRRVRTTWRRRCAQAALVGFTLVTGLSRVYLGMHWPSDVLGGYLVGAVFLAPLVWAHRRWGS